MMNKGHISNQNEAKNCAKKIQKNSECRGHKNNWWYSRGDPKSGPHKWAPKR